MRLCESVTIRKQDRLIVSEGMRRFAEFFCRVGHGRFLGRPRERQLLELNPRRCSSLQQKQCLSQPCSVQTHHPKRRLRSYSSDSFLSEYHCIRLSTHRGCLARNLAVQVIAKKTVCRGSRDIFAGDELHPFDSILHGTLFLKSLLPGRQPQVFSRHDDGRAMVKKVYIRRLRSYAAARRGFYYGIQQGQHD